MSWLDGKKTYIAALCAFIVVLAQAIENAMNGVPMNYQILFEAMIALAMIFLRKGIAKIPEVKQ
jgi:hypothetical protein